MPLATRLSTFLIKYRRWLLLSAVCHLGMAVFTVISIPMVIPFFRILFRQDASGINFTDAVGLEVSLHNFFSHIIDTYGTNKAMIYVCLALSFAFFFRNIFRYLSLILIAPLRNGIVRDLRGNIHKKLLFLPLKALSEERKGDLMARATIDIQEVDWSILSVLESIFKSPFIIIGSLTFMVLINVKLTLFALVLMVFTGVVIAGISRKLKKDSQSIQKKIGELTSIIEESLHGIKILKIFSGQKYRVAKFDKENQNYYLLNNAYALKRELSSPLSEFLGVSSVVILLWYGSSLVFKNEILPETFFAFILAFYQLIEPSKQISNAIFSIQKGNAALDRIFEIVNLHQEEEEVKEPSVKLNFSNSIHIENLSFTYPNADFPALDNINLSIFKGEKIGIVGESGSGKSTLVDIIVRLHQASSGNIYLDNQNIQTLPLSPYRELFGVVTQEPILFNDTVSQNIHLSKAYNETRIESVLKTANAYEFIHQRVDGVLYQIGERGNNLSGGERQRMTIARALYNDPPILIFDEATSSLDPNSEEIIKDSLSNALINRTAIIIAHKLVTIKELDRIIVLDKGKIVEEGSFTQLSQEGKYFKRILDKSYLI